MGRDYQNRLFADKANLFFPTPSEKNRALLCVKSFLHLRKFLGGQSRKFSGLARRQQRGNDTSSFFRHDVTMGLGHFGDQTVRTQQHQPPSHRRHLLTFAASVLGNVVEASADIAVTKAVERKVAPVDDSQKLSGFPEGIERPVAPSVAMHGSAHLSCFLGQRNLHMDRRQGGQMSLGSRPTHFGPLVQIRHAAALNFGGSGFIPVPGDYDGDGETDAAVYQSSSGNWFVVGSTDGFFSPALNFGGSGFIPVLPQVTILRALGLL